MTKKKSAHTDVTEEQEVSAQAPENQPEDGDQGGAVEVQGAAGSQPTAQTQGREDQLAEMQRLQKELDQARTKADEYLDGWQRARAEFANYKRRVERDQEQMYQNITGNIIKRYLDVADDLARALKNRPQDPEGAAWAQGIELIYRKLLSIMESEGVKPMEAEGQLFNPNMHEAITHEEAPGLESGQIIEVVNPGYTLGERVLRPALVRVAK